MQSLNESLTYAEIIEALKKQKNGKSPGPDGLPEEYCKELENVLLKPYKKLLEFVEEKGELPEETGEVA